MDSIIYRKSTEQDIVKISHQIAASYKTAYRNLMSEEYLSTLSADHWIPILQNAVSAGNTCLVAEYSDEIIGSIVFGRSNIEEYTNDVELFAIYLLPVYIGRGVGHTLYSEAEKTIMTNGFAGCVLEVLSENTQTVNFYTSHGFKEIKSFTVDENEMVLECRLMRKELCRL